jgi:hypothetical protein
MPYIEELKSLAFGDSLYNHLLENEFIILKKERFRLLLKRDYADTVLCALILSDGSIRFSVTEYDDEHEVNDYDMVDLFRATDTEQIDTLLKLMENHE